MADEIDHANEHAQHLLDTTIAHVRHRAGRIAHARECTDCDATINPLRRAAYPACTRCLACQNCYERRQRWSA